MRNPQVVTHNGTGHGREFKVSHPLREDLTPPAQSDSQRLSPRRGVPTLRGAGSLRNGDDGTRAGGQAGEAATLTPSWRIAFPRWRPIGSPVHLRSDNAAGIPLSCRLVVSFYRATRHPENTSGNPNTAGEGVGVGVP